VLDVEAHIVAGMHLSADGQYFSRCSGRDATPPPA
jgi:hypothetical protein